MMENTQCPTPIAHGPIRRIARWTAILAALAGWWLSLDLTRLSYGGSVSNPWLAASCGQSDQQAPSDCLSVLRSPHARLQLPNSPSLPVAVVGMGYFAFLALWHLLVGLPDRRRWYYQLLPLLVVVLGCVQSLYYVNLMARVLHSWCAGCVAVHVLNGLLALATLATFPWRAGSNPPSPAFRLAVATLLAGLAVFVVHLLLVLYVSARFNMQRAYEQYRLVVEDPAYVRWSYERQPVHAELLAADLPFVGPQNAPFSLVVFSDYQCPACRRLAQTLDQLRRRFSDRLRIAYLHYPLDRACNPELPADTHPGSCQAARAAVVARRVGTPAQFVEFSRSLFDNAARLAEIDYTELARRVGLPEQRFATLLASDESAAAVVRDVALAERVGVTATPAVFLNGRRLPALLTEDSLSALLQENDAPSASTPAAPPP